MKPPTKTHNHVPKAIGFLAGKNRPPKLHLLTNATGNGDSLLQSFLSKIFR